MSLVYLAGTNPWLSLFIGFDEEDSGESAGEVTEQLDLQQQTHMQGTAETELKHRLNLFQISPCFLISINEHSRAELHHIMMKCPGFTANIQLVFVARFASLFGHLVCLCVVLYLLSFCVSLCSF